MNILIVYAHPESTSFTAALKDTALRTLAAAGYKVEVSDLYGEGFNPVAGRHDFVTALDPQRFHYQSEQLHASKMAGFSTELAREQARLMRAELLLFVFPLWWGGLPAILKGWFDRVCAYGVAYADGMRFDQGYFVGRRAVLGIVTGGTPERFSAGNTYGEIGDVLYPVRRCMLEYLGFEVIEPFVAYAAPRVDDAAREDYLRRWEARLREIAADSSWHQRLRAQSGDAAANRKPDEGSAWSLQR
jgi:NAD(P)H dehydrogenase (quinone)